MHLYQVECGPKYSTNTTDFYEIVYCSQYSTSELIGHLKVFTATIYSLRESSRYKYIYNENVLGTSRKQKKVGRVKSINDLVEDLLVTISLLLQSIFS